MALLVTISLVSFKDILKTVYLVLCVNIICLYVMLLIENSLFQLANYLKNRKLSPPSHVRSGIPPFLVVEQRGTDQKHL